MIWWAKLWLLYEHTLHSYNAIKTWIQGGNARTPLGPGLHMLAAAEAGILSLVMTNPIWVVKTRLCLQYDDLTESKRYKGMVDGLSKIYKTEGIRGLYRVSYFSISRPNTWTKFVCIMFALCRVLCNVYYV